MDNDIENIHLLEIRLRFQGESESNAEVLTNCVKASLQNDAAPCSGKVSKNYLSLFPHEDDMHYWSPHLTVSFEDHEEHEGTEGCHISGLYGPRPTVWTMFMFFYSVIVFGILIISIVGFSQLSINDDGSLLYLLPVLILLFVGLYVVSFLGKKKGHDQIELLHHFLENCLGRSIGRHE